METPEANPVAGMRWFLSTYTARFNRRHELFGYRFSGRYKALIVDGSGNGYLQTVCGYVHLNPVRAKLLTPAEPLSAYRWSSWPDYLKPPAGRPVWLRVDRLLGAMRIAADRVAGRAGLGNDLERRREQEEGESFNGIRRGWCLGRAAFREDLLARARRLGGEACVAKLQIQSTLQNEFDLV